MYIVDDFRRTTDINFKCTLAMFWLFLQKVGVFQFLSSGVHLLLSYLFVAKQSSELNMGKSHHCAAKRI